MAEVREGEEGRLRMIVKKKNDREMVEEEKRRQGMMDKRKETGKEEINTRGQVFEG